MWIERGRRSIPKSQAGKFCSAGGAACAFLPFFPSVAVGVGVAGVGGGGAAAGGGGGGGGDGGGAAACGLLLD